jgi:hypothetical protein
LFPQPAVHRRTILEKSNTPKPVIDEFMGHDGDTGETCTHAGWDSLKRASRALADFMTKKRGGRRLLPPPKKRAVS